MKFRPGTPASETAKAHANARSAVLRTVPGIDVEVVKLPRGLSVARGVGLYQRNPNVEYAEPDYILEAQTTTPSDPYFRAQLELQGIHAGEAWDITRGSPDVMIAVLDTGLDYTHEDVQGRYMLGWDFVNDDADPWDDHSHGTIVFGVLGLATDNGIGLAAVTWHNPVMAIKVVGANGHASYSAICQGLVYAADQGAYAANVSCGGTGYSRALQDAVDYAWARQVVTVCAAGNYGNDTPVYPAACNHAIAVSAVSVDVLANYSSYGSYVDLSAPSVAWTIAPGNIYGTSGGTSVAAPYVSGAIGLVAAVDPALSAQQIVDIIQQTADDLGDPGWDEYYGWGQINLHQAVLAATQMSGGDTDPPNVAISSPGAGDELSGTVVLNAAASDDAGVIAVEFYVDDALLGSDAVDPYTWSWDTQTHSNGQHTLTALAYDAAGNVGYSTPVEVSVDNSPPNDTTAPVVTIAAPGPGDVVSDTAPVMVSATDDVEVAEVEFYLDGYMVGSDTAAPYLWAWDTQIDPDGPHTLVAVAYDAAGNVGESDPVGVTVDNSPPASEIVSPASGCIVSSVTQVAAHASDGVAVGHVDFYLDGEKRKTIAAPPFVWNWDTRDTGNGWHAIVARATDEAGNTGDSDPVDVEVQNVWTPTEQTDVFRGRAGGRNGWASLWVTTAADGPLSVALRYRGKAALDLYVYDAGGQLLARDITRANPKHIYLDVPAGRYRFVIGSVRWKSDYELEVTHF